MSPTRFSATAKTLGLAGYRTMLEGDSAAIPDLFFKIDFIVSEPPTVGARLIFDCTPKGELFGLPVNGKRVSFTENRLLPVQGREDRYRLVGDRPGHHRGAALAQERRS
jgi:predicted ester cyclase